MKRVLACLCSLILLLATIAPVYAEETAVSINPTTVPINQFSQLWKNDARILKGWKDLGMSDSSLNALLSLPKKDASFYSEPSPAAQSNNTGTLDISAEDEEQIDRIVYVSGVTATWLGNTNVNSDVYNRYLTYFYISHYVDNPLYPNLTSRLPYILTSYDIDAYETYLSRGSAIQAANSVSSLINGTYSLQNDWQSYLSGSELGMDSLYTAKGILGTPDNLIGTKSSINDLVNYICQVYPTATSEVALLNSIKNAEQIQSYNNNEKEIIAQAYLDSLLSPYNEPLTLIGGVSGFFARYGSYFDMANKGSLDYSHSSRYYQRYYYWLTHM